MRIDYPELEAFLDTFHGTKTGPRFLIISWDPERLEQTFIYKKGKWSSIDLTRLFLLCTRCDTEVKFAMELPFSEHKTKCCEECAATVALDDPNFTKYKRDACDHSYQDLDFSPLLVLAPPKVYKSIRDINDLFRHNNVEWLTLIRTGSIFSIRLTHSFDDDDEPGFLNIKMDSDPTSEDGEDWVGGRTFFDIYERRRRWLRDALGLDRKRLPHLVLNFSVPVYAGKTRSTCGDFTRL